MSDLTISFDLFLLRGKQPLSHSYRHDYMLIIAWHLIGNYVEMEGKYMC